MSRNARLTPSAVSLSPGVDRSTNASSANTNATIPSVVSDTRMPTVSATPPNIGPRIAPAIAPKAIPIISPRFSFGATPATHARAPAQVTVLEKP